MMKACTGWFAVVLHTFVMKMSVYNAVDPWSGESVVF